LFDLKIEFLKIEAQPVARFQLRLGGKPNTVDKRAVSGTEIFHPHDLIDDAQLCVTPRGQALRNAQTAFFGATHQ